jgi:hypothetical protein
MRGLRLSLAVCMGVIACTKVENRERPAEDRSPYGELEIARTDEVPTTVDTSSRPVPPPRHSTRRPSKRAPRPASPTASAESTRSPDTAVVPASPPADSSGYPAYPVDDPATADTATPRLPAPAPATVPPSPAAANVPAGTVIHAALEDSIHSRLDAAGRTVAAKVMQNVTGPDGRTLIPAGAPVQLTVTEVRPGRGDRQGVLEIRPDSITLAGGSRKLEARLQPVPYELRGRGVTGEEAAKVGVGAAGGAVVGRVLGGNSKGAVIGGVVGAAGGAVVASQTAAKDVVVKARTPLALVLTAPIVFPR